MYLLCASNDCIFQGLVQKGTNFNDTGYNQEFNFHKLQVTSKAHSQVTRKPKSSGFQTRWMILRFICSPSLQWHLVEKKQLERRNRLEGKMLTMQSFPSSTKQPYSNPSEGIRVWSGCIEKRTSCWCEAVTIYWKQKPVLLRKREFAIQNEFKSFSMELETELNAA